MNSKKPWLKSYPEGVPNEINLEAYTCLLDIFDEAFEKFSKHNACEYLKKLFTYGQIDTLSMNFATYLQNLELGSGARIAIMLPNVVQYQISMLGILRAGYTVVNVNPQYTSRELEHQLKDSGASVLIVLENFAHTYQAISSSVPMKKVIVTSLGELLGLKGIFVDFVVRKIKRLVPRWSLEHESFASVLISGKTLKYKKPVVKPNDIAFLQYTGGTTGIAKGAILQHKNVLANLLQIEVWLEPGLKNRSVDPLGFLCALPFYHIFALTACLLLGMRKGGVLILVPNPRDIKGFIKLLAAHSNINIFPGVNTLFNALIQRIEFQKLNFSNLLVTIGGGMAVQQVVANRWHQITGVPIAEGYGLSETSPVACVNTPIIKSFTGTIGMPVPGTEVLILDDEGFEMPYGVPGEICIRGPQVMSGYWNNESESKRAFTKAGFFKSGDIGIMSEEGYVKIVDRKKDMILVSGFNVYPNELEAVISMLPGVSECAAIGVPSNETGEAVKVFIVKNNPELTENDVFDFCRSELTSYKRPKYIQFSDDLPKTNVGKILRRELRHLD